MRTPGRIVDPPYTPDLCVRFRQDSFRNGREVRFQRYKGLPYYGMIPLASLLTLPR